MTLGSPAAPVGLVAYSDYQCPACRRFHDEALARLRRDYIDTGKLILMVRDLPLGAHQQSLPAALAARCAAQQDRFWAMNAALFANQEALGPALYERLARELGLDGERFARCREEPATLQQVRADIATAGELRIGRAPGFVLGRFDGGRLQVERIASGEVSFETLAREIDALLAKPAAAPGAGTDRAGKGKP